MRPIKEGKGGREERGGERKGSGEGGREWHLYDRIPSTALEGWESRATIRLSPQFFSPKLVQQSLSEGRGHLG